MRRIISIVGTRPEAIKMAPLHLAMREREHLEPLLVATGQHGALFDQALAPFGLAPDERLAMPVASSDPIDMASQMAEHIGSVLIRLAPDLVLVQGDTTSALAAAQAAARLGIAIGHVEAGLRSFDLKRPYPEEGNRIAIDRLSDLLFAPTDSAMDNLAIDPFASGTAYLTGNTGIDALFHIRSTLPAAPRADRSKLRILVTLHRREVIGDPLRDICHALRVLADSGNIAITLPLHPNPHVQIIVREVLGTHQSISLVSPYDYPEMIARMAAADLILSDSGGVQEEAPALGTPLLILRDTTERPEAVSSGAAILASTNPAQILAHAQRLLDDKALRKRMAQPRFPFGRGDASRKIVTVIEQSLGLSNVTSEPSWASGLRYEQDEDNVTRLGAGKLARA